MSEEIKSTQDNINSALKLDGKPENVREYYDQWAQSYDADVESIEYAGPQMAVRLLTEFINPGEGLKFLDAGCGTGLVGTVLKENGFDLISGFDLSPAMAQHASDTGCYQSVQGDVDIMRVDKHFTPASFDVVLCVGVFTLGHVPPQALLELINLLQPGGLLVISVRKLYYDETEFQGVLDKALSEKQIEVLRQLENARYNKDGPEDTEGLAHYWVIQRIQS